MRVLVCLVAIAGCGRTPVTEQRPQAALLTALAASVELGSNGLPGKGARAWVAAGKDGLATVPTRLSVDVRVGGKALPSGRLTRQYSGLKFEGENDGYRFDLVAREAGTFAFELTVISRGQPDIAWSAQLPPGWTSRTSRSHRLQGDRQIQVSRLVVTAPRDDPGQDALPPRIVVEGSDEDQSRLDDLARALGPDRALGYCGLSPFGSSSTKYTGRVFWDADMWLLPALALTHPVRAKAVPKFRSATLGAAQVAFADRFDTSEAGIIVPWETGTDGSERCTGPGVQAAHVTGSAAWAMGYAARMGLVAPEAAEQYRLLAQAYYLRRAQVSGGQVSVPETLSPDEFAMTPSDAYTNLVAHLAVRQGSPALPSAGDRLLNFEGDGRQKLQQHALLLGLWPLQHPALTPRAREVLAFEKGRTTPNGPAMSLSLEALLEARYSDPEAALYTWRRSIDRYAYGPARSFGETPRLHEGSFLTGVAGCWSAVVYGFAGVHVGESPVSGAVWYRRLRSGTWVSARPNLPPSWKSLTVPLHLDGEPVVLNLTMGMRAKPSPDSR